MPQDRPGPFLGDPVPLLHASRRIQILNSNGRCGCLGLAVCLAQKLSRRGTSFSLRRQTKADAGTKGQPEVPTEVADRRCRRRSPTERRAPTEVADGGRCAESESPNLDSSQHRSVPACPANPQPGRARLLVLSLRPGRLYRHSRARNAHLIDGHGRGRSTARCFCLCFLVIL